MGRGRGLGTFGSPYGHAAPGGSARSAAVGSYMRASAGSGAGGGDGYMPPVKTLRDAGE